MYLRNLTKAETLEELYTNEQHT